MQLVDPADAELLPAAHGLHMVDDDDDDDDDEDERSTKDPAGQVEAAVQFVAQIHRWPFVPHGLPL